MSIMRNHCSMRWHQTSRSAPASIGIVVTATQIGYALGLLFIVPLGDFLDRRRLIVAQSVASALALTIVGLAPTAGVLLTGMVAVGLLAVAVQVLVAFAASLHTGRTRKNRRHGHQRRRARHSAGPLRGRTPGRYWWLAFGLPRFGGRDTTYGHFAVPDLATAQDGKRGDFLSTIAAFDGHAVRRGTNSPGPRRVAMLIFATFGVLWTSMVLPLSAPPFFLSHTEVGLFGLAVVAGALTAGGPRL